MTDALANFISETCTGTGDTLTLTGAVSGLLTYALNFADGDLVRYIVKDSGGSIKVSGLGTYNTSGNTITRNDGYNFNGTVVDNDPSTNITLSAGTHEVSCDFDLKSTVARSPNAKTSQTRIMNGVINSASGAATNSMNADQQRGFVFRLMETAPIATLDIVVLTADAGGLASIGLNKCIDGIPDTSYIASGTIDITSTGAKSITVNEDLEAGYYFCHIVTDSATAAFNSSGATYNNRAIGWTPLRSTLFNNRFTPCISLSKASVINGILDVDPETITSNSHADTGDSILLFTMTRG